MKRLIRYRVAHPVPIKIMRNRLGGRTIGIALVVGPHCFSWVWKRP